MNSTTPTPQAILLPEDSKRVADAMIEAIQNTSATIIQRHDAMCAQIEHNHWTAEMQRVSPPKFGTL